MGSRLEANSSAVRKRIEKHKFDNEEGEEYEPSKFGGFNDYFRRKKIKLQNLDAERRSSSGDKPPIFKGVVAHVNGYTQPSLNDLHSLIVSYGGGFMQYLDGKTTVTHIIASNLTPKKKVEFSKYRIVKPAWVVDSVHAGRLLPWDAYRAVDEGAGQRVLGFENGNIASQVNRLGAGYKDQTDKSWYTEQVKDLADEVDLQNQAQALCRVGPEIENDENIEPEASSPASNRYEDELPFNVAADGPNESYQAILSREDFSLSIYPDPLERHARSTLDEVPLPERQIYEDNALERCDTEPFAVAGAYHENVSPTTRAKSELEVHHKENAVRTLESQQAAPKTESTVPELERSTSDFTGESISNIEDLENPYTLPTPALHRTDSVSPSKPTAEEHNALLLADPRVRKSTVVNPEFLKQYYEESRLHHLSAWKADLKSRLQKLAVEKTSSQQSREKRPPGSRRYILHVDFDSFFAAVSLRKCPQYIDKPVVVAHGGGSGSEIASCNYPARKFGIKNGMWMKHAQKMCFDLKVLPYDFPAYEEASRNFYDAIMETGGIVQSVSVDEALVDVSIECITAGGHNGKGIHEGSIWREQAKADEIATALRAKIKAKTGCAVSVGIGGNILLAKVALRKAKPAGQYHVKPEDVLDFLGGLTVQELPGVAYSIGGKLEEIGVRYVKDVRELTKEKMITTLGPKTGEKIWDYSRGIDRTEVGEQVVRKSVSAEVNWGIRFATQDQAEEFINSLCEELHKRLVIEQVKGRQLTMKIMRRALDAPLDPPKHLGHGKCDTFNKSLILGVATNDKNIIAREALSILRGFGFSPGELRGLGVQMQRLEPLKGTVDSPQDSSQRKLQFSTSDAKKRRPDQSEDVIDSIETPQKPKLPPDHHPAATFARDTSPSGKPRKSLNTAGTQFVLPTQVDQEVLDQLPQDIRSRLLEREANLESSDQEEPASQASSQSATPGPILDAIPAQSQLDQEILNALPDDVRAEILAFYHKSPHKAVAQANQALLPQSPRKARTIKLPKKLTTPTKKRVGLLGRNNRFSAGGSSTLTQSNFVANAKSAAASKSNTGDTSADVSDDFLAALPEDIRREVLAQARRDRLQKRGGIDITSKRKKAPNAGNQLPAGQRTLTLPPRPPKPTFTAQKFTQLPQLRQAISAWFDEFREDGPFAEDADVLVTYLQKVVLEEQDMEKAVSVAKWLGWVVDEGDAKRSWTETLKKVRNGVQDAVRKRGLGRVEF